MFELIQHGWNQLADPNDSKSIPSCVREVMSQTKPAYIDGLYGDGNAAKLMIEKIINFK